MRNWGVVIAVFYTVVVLLLMSYGVILLAEAGSDVTGLPDSLGAFIQVLLEVSWMPVLILVGGQALLLFLSVDTSWRRMQPQRHAKVTAGLVGLMVAILALSAVFAIGMARSGDDFSPASAPILGSTLLAWALWAALFYVFSKRVSDVIDSAVSWLIKGSVLELLIAVPCHLIVRQRDVCCAQYVSAVGIATGIAIMLMAFGPSVLFLYQRKLRNYTARQQG